jgi:hypothetical protein
MTTQQLARRFRTALNCLIDQATGQPSQIASKVVLSPCYFGLGAVQFPPVTNADARFRRPRCLQQPGQTLYSLHSGHPGTIQSP